jgi:hypothetical protein
VDGTEIIARDRSQEEVLVSVAQSYVFHTLIVADYTRVVKYQMVSHEDF